MQVVAAIEILVMRILLNKDKVQRHTPLNK